MFLDGKHAVDNIYSLSIYLHGKNNIVLVIVNVCVYFQATPVETVVFLISTSSIGMILNKWQEEQ